MVLVNRLLPWIVALLALVLTERIFLSPRQLPVLAGLLMVAVILSVWQLTGRRWRHIKFWRFVMTPVLFTAAGLLFLVFLKGVVVRQVALVGYSAGVWLFLEVIFLRFNFRPKYQIHSLENIFTHLELLTIFFIASGFFSIAVFLGITLPLLALIFMAVVLLFSYQVIWTSDANLLSVWPYAAVVAVTMTEIFFAVGYLPTSVYVGGVLVGASYYLITGLIRNWLLGNQEWPVVKRYVIVALAVMLAVLASARWF